MKTAKELIDQELKEQREKHGYDLTHDVQVNNECQLYHAAIKIQGSELNPPPENWNTFIWNKITGKPKKERLIISGAFLKAEIERLEHELRCTERRIEIINRES